MMFLYLLSNGHTFVKLVSNTEQTPENLPCGWMVAAKISNYGADMANCEVVDGLGKPILQVS